MNVVASSGWLEYFADEANADFFAPAIEAPKDLLVPAISLYEVFKRVCWQAGESEGLNAVAQMALGQVVDVDMTLALSAAKLSLAHKLPMVDSLILATAHAYHAVLWTQDEHFKAIPGVRYARK